MKKITNKTLENLLVVAKKSERKRKNQNYHESFADPINRMLNALLPDTYVQPHKHKSPDKDEIFVILTGTMAVIEFDNSGEITDTIVLNHKKGTYIAEIEAETWHTVVALEETVYYEIKHGPYDPNNDKQFAEWAPAENESDAEEYLNKLKSTVIQ